MDFMTHLLESKGFNSIMVVVDRVSKMAYFVLTRDTATAQEIGRLYFDKVVKHHGMQKTSFRIGIRNLRVVSGVHFGRNWARSSR